MLFVLAGFDLSRTGRFTPISRDTVFLYRIDYNLYTLGAIDSNPKRLIQFDAAVRVRSSAQRHAQIIRGLSGIGFQKPGAYGAQRLRTSGKEQAEIAGSRRVGASRGRGGCNGWFVNGPSRNNGGGFRMPGWPYYLLGNHHVYVGSVSQDKEQEGRDATKSG